MSYTHDDLAYRQYGHAPQQGGSIYAPVQGPGVTQAPVQGVNALGPQAMAAAAPGGPQAPAMPQNQLMQPPPPLQPPAWQEEWQRVYDQMLQLGHEDPQTVAYQTIAKYGLGPYAQPAGPAYGGGVSGGGG